MTTEEKTIERAAEEREVDTQAFLKAKELILALANTISALKIFPAHHASAVHFRQDFISKLKSFLDDYQKFELEIGEFAFFFQGKQIYQDEISSKSLPFFFYKDGLRLLVLYQGMDDQEINELLDLIRQESAKPAEESDFVNALWLKDLPNVQYYAPEEFIESRILEERAETLSKKGLQIIPQELADRVVDIKVDRERLFSGQIELKPEERQALEKFKEDDLPELPETWQQTMDFIETTKSEAEADESETQKKAQQTPSSDMLILSSEDQETLQRLIEKNRYLSPEEEFLNLMMEILALENDLEQFKTNLNILRDFYQENIKSGNLKIPIIMDRKIRDLKPIVASDQPDKIPLLEDFLASSSSLKILDEIRKLVDQKVELNYEALYDYLIQFGEAALPFLAELFEKIDQPDFRAKIKNHVRQKLEETPQLAPAFIDDQKPALTEAVIEIMSTLPAKKIIPQFSTFITLSNQALKLKAIEALSSFSEEMANKILLGFMNDPDSQVRLKATTSLKFLGDTTRLQQLMKDIFTPQFRKKSFEEKKALFEFIGRTRRAEAFSFLKKVFLKKSFWPSITELRVCAVAGLEAMGTKEAVDLLRRGERFLRRRVREAAAEALVRLTIKNSKEQ
mgnify:CR=1 FL=1